MKYFPIFVALEGRDVVVSGGGDAALAKLRLLMKTEARLIVYAEAPISDIESLAAEGWLTLHRRPIAPGDTKDAALFYAANDDDEEDARVTALARADGALSNWVDNLEASAFITPAIVDRDPVTVAIGTEGTAPVLARAIKADLEERLPPTLGLLARIGQAFRSTAEALPVGRARRAFWSDYFFRAGPRAVSNGEDAVRETLADLLTDHLDRRPDEGRVSFVGAGPGDPDLLTLKARKALHDADVVIHDRLVPAPILELARREATIIEMGKAGFGPSVKQADIDALLVEHARSGAHVVRLKSGDPTVFGRLDEELDAVVAAGIAYEIVPGITSASAAVAALGQSLTKRARNSAVRLVTGHDMEGYAEQDWRTLARPGEVAAIYMGKKAARFVQGRLLMHGAAPDTPVSAVENASRPDQQILATSLSRLAEDLSAAQFDGPVLILLGLAPRDATDALQNREIAL